MPTANELYASTRFKRRVPSDPRLVAALNSPSYKADLMRLRMGGQSAVKDAAATGQIFLQSELNKADTRLHMPLEGHTWFRDVPLTNGGGWVDTETAEFVEVFSPGGDGVTGGESNDIGIVNFNRSQDVYPTAPYQRSIRIPLVDSLRLAQANKSPNDILDKAVRTDWNKVLDRRIYQGRGSTYGLLNQPLVLAQSAANGAAGGPSWNQKTPQEIVNDFQNAAQIAWSRSGNAIDAIPDRFLVPASAWALLLQPMVLNIPGSNSTAPYATILEWIKGHYFGLSINGKVPEILPLPSWAETAGAGNSRRLVSYKFSDEYLSFSILQDLQRMGGPLSLQDGAFVATYIGNLGVVKVYRTTSMLYQDNI